MAKVEIGNSSIEVNSDKAALKAQKAEHNFQLQKLRIKFATFFVIALAIVVCAIEVPDMRKYIAEGVGSFAVGKLGFGVYDKIAGKVRK